MPRTARYTHSHGFYHIYNRGLNKAPIFLDPKDYDRMLSILKVLSHEGDWVLYAYCFMPNHYHMLVEEVHTPIAKLIGRLFTSYSLYFNKKYSRNGPLFQDRFKSKLIQKDTYFFELSRYIHCNPAKAGLIEDPRTYPYSSLHEYEDSTSNNIIQKDKVEKLLAMTDRSIRSYIEFVLAGLQLNLNNFDPFINHNEVLGSRTFSSHRKKKAF